MKGLKKPYDPVYVKLSYIGGQSEDCEHNPYHQKEISFPDHDMKGGYFNALKQPNNSCLQILADDLFCSL